MLVSWNAEKIARLSTTLAQPAATNAARALGGMAPQRTQSRPRACR